MKLEGLRVVDASQFLPGPLLTLALADHGAEVTKIEPEGGEPGRRIGERIGAETVFFRNLNRGKTSVAVDLKTEAGRATLLALVDQADVFIESFRPGAMARLGLDQQTLRARNPRLVYCSISAFGQTGAQAGRPAHDLALQALAGVTGLQRGADGQPVMPAVAIADVLSGLQGLAGVLMALLRREKTGRGDAVDIAMLDSMVAALPNIVGPTLAEGRQPVPAHERTMGGSAFYRLYATADGGHIALAGQEPKFVHALLGAIGRPELAEPVLRGPGAHQADAIAALEAVFRGRTRAACEALLGSIDVCWGSVRTLPEACADPELAARGMLLRDAGGGLQIGSPIRFADEPSSLNLRVPALGAPSSTSGDDR
jgi:crotonobetainyl-CoA:carnitine CoA-transferase CaiB-like acyl-CoA transferase